MTTLFTLTRDHISTPQGYVSTGSYPAAYGYTGGLLDDANVNWNAAVTDASNRFGIAAQLDGNTGFFGSFVRG
ncbi:hypothetical protein SAMN05192563_102427 [Paraburkholderia aspalathi]|uniref:Uncharacterized protein n=1 Tax=Paraburkholderia aspalathi TaxID=1324617 RepID=A0A1I7EJ77_9BURK|nr:hypothetical protein SAMN05192563_102427 [Paraburkholderia aspalathi]